MATQDVIFQQQLQQNDTSLVIKDNLTNDQNMNKNNDTSITSKSISTMTRNLSEMSIECSTGKTKYELDTTHILLENKIKSVFELPEAEALINEFPCYLIRLVTIKGWMYITTNYICFYASLAGKKKGPYKTGYLSKKNGITSPSYRYFFELKQNVLSWYTLAETRYSPLNSIDLKHVTNIEPSKTKKFGIRLFTNSSQSYTLIADSEISQKEWLDELKKGLFVAHHPENSIRILLPFSKINNVDKTSVYHFATNNSIKINFQEDSSENCLGEDYYFAFFPEIEKAYLEIIETWKNVSSDQKKIDIDSNLEKSETDVSSSSSKIIENMSPSAFPTMLMNKLLNIINSNQYYGNSINTDSDQLINSPDEQNELVPDSDSPTNKYNSFSFNKLSIISNDNYINKKKEDSVSPISTELPSPSSIARFKRRSLFFTRSSDNIDNSISIKDVSSTPDLRQNLGYSKPNRLIENDFKVNHDHSQDQKVILDDTITKKSLPLVFSKIPRAISDAIKNQVIRNDTSILVNCNSSTLTKVEPIESNELEVIESSQKNNANNKVEEQALMHDKLDKNLSSKPSTASNHNRYISVINQDFKNLITRKNETPKIKIQFAKTMNSIFVNANWNILSFSGIDLSHHQQNVNENQFKCPKGSIWLNNKMIESLCKFTTDTNSSDDDTDSNTDSDADDDHITNFTVGYFNSAYNNKSEILELRQKEQSSMNDQLNNDFPMLLKTEQTEAAFKAAFWRAIPYSGKIYITDNHFCFSSKILAGQQKLIIPWHDVIQVTKIKSRSYFLMYGMTMVVKDLIEEIYFDFTTLKLRDYCFSICKLKANKSLVGDGSSIISKESRVLSLSSLLLDRDEHVTPPIEYDGPPLLSSFNSTPKISTKYKPLPKPLHITCLTIGSRGDVQPYIALCKELQKDGHTCRIATHPEYENWITQHNIEFRSIGGDPGELMKLCIDNSFLSVSFIREGTKFFYSWFESLLHSAYVACQGTDLIIESPSAMIGVHMAEKLGVPYFRSMPFPFTRTTKFPHPFALQSTAGGRIYNDMTYVMIDMALWIGTAKYVNRFRREVLNLPSTNMDRLELWKVPYIYSFSPTVVHPPKDWPDFIHCTGYWFLDNSDTKWKPDPELVKFLDKTIDKRPIVYIGFGSIIVPNPAETTRTIVEAVLKADVRAVICKGWSARITGSKSSAVTNPHKKSHSANDAEKNVQEQPENDEDDDLILKKYPKSIYHIDSIPHDWLFPQIQGVVHHGGAGTTAAGLRAGLPTIIKPFFGDQRFWGQRIEELQIGICLNKLTKNQLCDALISITQNQALIFKAQKIGELIKKENGPRNAVECIYRELEFAREQRIATGSP